MTTCIRCNRELKDPESVERGYGPTCWARIQADKAVNDEQMDDEFINEPTDEVIVMRRTERGVQTNVPHLVIDHSPRGYEFGYGGNGPADLALNILELVLRQMGHKGETTTNTRSGSKCFLMAFELHQAFKWEFIANIPREGGEIRTNDIINWIEAQRPMYEKEGLT